MIGVIGGTGLYRLADLQTREVAPPETPFGPASSHIAIGSLRGPGSPEVAFLARHGADHRLAPHQVPCRANIWALREAGVNEIVAVNSVGSLRPEWVAGQIVVPDQIIDYTWGRELTFVEAGDPVLHLDFSQPYTAGLRARILSAAASAGLDPIDGATYGCTQGPRFETPAEIRRMARDGCDLVGMTAMPEAYLAHEAGLAYASICVVANLAAGLAGPDQVLTHDEVATASAGSLSAVEGILTALTATS